MPHNTKQKIKRIVHSQILLVFAFSIVLSSSHLTALAATDPNTTINPVVTPPSNLPVEITITGGSTLNGIANNKPMPVVGLHVNGTSTDPITVKINVDSGTLSMGVTTNLTFTSNSTGSSLEFTGLIDDVNRSLLSLSYQTDKAGKATLTTSVDTSTLSPSTAPNTNTLPPHHQNPNTTTLSISTVTPPPVNPSTADMSIYTNGPQNTTDRSTTLKGNISDTTSTITDRGFEWGKDTNYGNTTSAHKDPVTFLSKFGSYGSGDGQFIYPNSFVINKTNGYIYVADGYNYRIEIFDSNGNFLSKFGSGGYGDGQFNFPRGIAQDSFGNIYVADLYNARIQKFDSNGNYLSQFGSGGSGDGQFNYPQGIFVEPNGNILVSDSGNHRVEKFDSNGNYLSQFGSGGSGDGQFEYPFGVAETSSGDIYVSDFLSGNLQKFSNSGSFISKKTGLYSSRFLTTNDSDQIYLGAQGTQYGVNVFDSDLNIISQFGTASQLSGPYQATNIGNKIYVVDSSNNRIQILSNDPGILLGSFTSDLTGLDCNTTYHYRAYGTNGSGTYYGDDATFTTGSCSVVTTKPATGTTSSSTTLNASADSTYSLIKNYGFNLGNSTSYGTTVNAIPSQKVSSKFSITFGNSGDEHLNRPEGVTTDSLGNVYVADSRNNRIVKYDSNGNYLLQWTNPDFSYPYALATDSSNNVYVSDWGSCSLASNIKVFDSSGNYLRQFGSQGSGDGQFGCGTTGITIDTNNNIYVGDYDNNRVEKFDQAGNYLSQWGSWNDTNLFGRIYGLTHDSQNNIYVIDAYNDQVQKFDSNGNYISSIAQGLNLAYDSFNGIAVDSNNQLYIGAYSSDPPITVFDTTTGGQIAAVGTYGEELNQLNGTEGLAIDSNGNLYVSDYSYGKVLKFTPAPFYSLGSFSSSVAGLVCGTTYHYQAFMTNQEQTYTGSDQQFSTNACGGGNIAPITPLTSAGTTATEEPTQSVAPVVSNTTTLSSIPTNTTPAVSKSFWKSFLDYLPYGLVGIVLLSLMGYELYSYSHTAAVRGRRKTT